MSEEKKTRKCWGCRKDIPDTGKIFCDECEDKPEARKSGATLVIYDKI